MIGIIFRKKISAYAKIRSAGQKSACDIYIEDDAAKVEFLEPQNAITPGQAVVFIRMILYLEEAL